MDFQNSIGRKLANNTIQLQTCATLQEKRRMTLRVELRAQTVESLATLFPGLIEFDLLNFEIV